MMLSRLRHARRHGHCDRGAVLIEMVIITPVLLLISLAVFDVGMGFKTSLSITNSVRAGARVGSNLGVDDLADSATINAVGSALRDIPVNEIEMVVIYRSTTADGAPPAACLTPVALANGGSSANNCSTYSTAELDAIAYGNGSPPSFTGNCSTSRDRRWCSKTRNNTQTTTGGLDYLGVYVRVNHSTNTKIFGSTMVIDDHAVMRIEPNAGE